MNKDSGLKKSFLIRLRSSVVLMTVLILLMISRPEILIGGLLVISLIGLMEIYRTVGINKAWIAVPGYIATFVYYTWYLILHEFRGEDFYDRITEIGGILAVIGGLLLISVLAIYVFMFPKIDSKQVTMAFFGFFYVVVCMAYIYRLRDIDSGAYSVWLIFISSWGADTMAYLTGILIGKHKIAPVLSPKKTLEGCIGGVVGAMLIGFIYSSIFSEQLGEYFENPVAIFTIVSAVASVVSMIGDLAASAFKRNMEIKDYGRLIPGHGGVLDRFDSVIFVAPVIYALLVFFEI